MSGHLPSRLDECLRSGALDDVTLARVMNEAINEGISEAGEDPEGFERRAALVAMAAAMARSLIRRGCGALVRGRWLRAWFICQLCRHLTGWGLDMSRADLDPDADMLRIRTLQLHLAGSGLAEAQALAPAVRALARVGLAGTSPVH